MQQIHLNKHSPVNMKRVCVCVLGAHVHHMQYYITTYRSKQTESTFHTPPGLPRVVLGNFFPLSLQQER